MNSALSLLLPARSEEFGKQIHLCLSSTYIFCSSLPSHPLPFPSSSIFQDLKASTDSFFDFETSTSITHLHYHTHSSAPNNSLIPSPAHLPTAIPIHCCRCSRSLFCPPITNQILSKPQHHQSQWVANCGPRRRRTTSGRRSCPTPTRSWATPETRGARSRPGSSWLPTCAQRWRPSSGSWARKCRESTRL